MKAPTIQSAVASLDTAVASLTALRARLVDDTSGRRRLNTLDAGAAVAALNGVAEAIAFDILAEAARLPGHEGVVLLDRLGESVRFGSSSDPVEQSVSVAVHRAVADAIQRRLLQRERDAYLEAR